MEMIGKNDIYLEQHIANGDSSDQGGWVNSCAEKG